jgi:ketosteroid isomerase-like protein
MPQSPAALAPASADTAEAAALVERFLVASMVPDPETASTFMSSDVDITFTGGRKFKHPRDATAFNAMRYKWVKKKMERTDVSPGNGETIVYNTGTLYGEWHDGTPFEGNRYVDRFVVRDGKIVKMDVWNDSAERVLVRMDIEA